MKRRKQKAGILFLLILCLYMGGCGNESAPAYQELSEGDEAPDFTAELTDGSSFTLSDQIGEVVLLNFWGTWCSPCIREMPAFEKLYEEYGEQIEILAINCGETKEVVDKFLQDRSYEFPIAYDETSEISEKYPSEGIPYTLVIGKDGRVAALFMGAEDAETQYKIYRRAIKAALEGE